MYFTVEEENLICLYHNADRRRTAANLRAALPDMGKEMAALTCQTADKLDAMSDADSVSYTHLDVYKRQAAGIGNPGHPRLHLRKTGADGLCGAQGKTATSHQGRPQTCLCAAGSADLSPAYGTVGNGEMCIRDRVYPILRYIAEIETGRCRNRPQGGDVT